MSQSETYLPILSPELQISFYYRFRELDQLYLREALRRTVEALDVREVDKELAEYVSPEALARVASFGLRGEVLFATPCLLKSNPYLLGYYRLLLGLSQKEFYQRGPFGRFKKVEDDGEVPGRLEPQVPDLCRSLVGSAELLLRGVDDLSLSLIRDLQVLTLGPQLRGSRNTQLGQEATQQVFDLVKEIVIAYATYSDERTIKLVNESGRAVIITFLSDPDIGVIELLPSRDRSLVSMEIKGGSDVSNIHNRLGEAEKSHQKARQLGFRDFWTITRVRVDREVAQRESPTTTRFFSLNELLTPPSEEHRDFRERLCSILGIRV